MSLANVQQRIIQLAEDYEFDVDLDDRLFDRGVSGTAVAVFLHEVGEEFDISIRLGDYSELDTLREITERVKEDMKLAVWKKGKTIRGRDPDEWRRDSFGSLMRFSMYGNRKSDHGWEIDHIIRRRDRGSDALRNLRPLNWNNNAARG